MAKQVDPTKLVKKGESNGTEPKINPSLLKKKESKEPTESPSTTAQSVPSLESQEKTSKQPDWVVQSPQEAETAPLENLRDSIEYYLDLYKDKGFGFLDETGELKLSPIGKLLRESEEIYNRRIRTEGALSDRVLIARSDIYQDFLRENIEKGLLKEEEISLPQDDIFNIVAQRSVEQEQPETPSGQFDWGPTMFGQETETEEEIKERYVKLNKDNYAQELAKQTKERILSQIPEEDRNLEELKKVEDKLWVENGVQIDLTGEGRFGFDKSNFFIPLQSQTENIILSLADLAVSGRSPLAGMEIRDFRKNELERLSKKTTQIEGDILDNLSEGRFGNATALTFQQLGDALPLMAITRGVGGTSSKLLSTETGAALAAMSAVTGITHYQDVRDKDWFKNNLNDAQKLGYLAAYGLAEGTDILIGSQILKRAARQGATVNSEGAKAWLKEFFKGMGYGIGEEALSEGVTGVIQYSLDEAAQGREITFDGLVDAFKRNAVAGAAGGLGMSGAPRLAAKGWSLALRTPEFIGMKKAEKKLVEDIENTENEAELEVLTVELEKVQETKSNLFKSQRQLIDSMSEEDANAYAEAIATFNAYRERLSEMDEKSNAYQIAEKEAQKSLEQAQDIKAKYEGVQQTEAFRERERDEFSEQDLIELEKKIDSEERTKRDREQPERTPKPSQVETPEQEKKITALEMLGEKVQDENGVVGTITEENGSIVWESEDGSLVREGGGVTDAETVTLDDMRLSLIPESPTNPVQLNKGEPSEAPKPREKGISKEELEVMDEIEFEEKVAQSEREVAEFEDQVLDEVAKKDTNQDLVEVKGNVYQVTKKKDGSFTVSKMREDGRLIRNTDKNETTQAIAQFKRAKTNQQKRDLAQAEELISEFKKEQDDKILSWLETKIQQTDTRGRAFDAGLGIPMFAANSALKIVRASYKAGKALAEAIQDGINYLKRNGYNVDPTEFKKYILQQSKQQPNVKRNVDLSKDEQTVQVKDKEGRVYNAQVFTVEEDDGSKSVTLIIPMDGVNASGQINMGRDVLAEFSFSLKEGNIKPSYISVNENFRRKGIASDIYNLFKESGYEILQGKKLKDGEKFRKAYDSKTKTPQKVRGQNTQGQKTPQKGKAKTAKQALTNAAKGFTNGESFGKQVQEALKPFTKGRGKITNSQASTLAKRAANVQNQAQLDKFLEYAEKVLSKSDFIGKVKQAKSRAKTARNRYNSGKIVADNGDTLRALTLDPENLSVEELDRYNDFLNRINSNNFERLNQENIDDIEYFANKYEAKEPAPKKEKGEKAQQTLSQAKEQLKENIKLKLDEEVADVVTNENLNLVESLTDEEIDSLSKQEVEALTSSLNDVKNGGIFSSTAMAAINKVKQNRGSETVKEGIQDKSFKTLLRDFFNPKTYLNRKGSKADRLKSLIRNMPLNRIDAIARGAMNVSKPIYKTLIQPVSKAYSMYEGAVRSFERDLTRIIKSIPKKQRRKAAVRLAIIGLAKQKAMNPKDSKLSSIEDYMKDIKEDGTKINNYQKEANLYIEVYEEMLGDDKSFDWQKAFNKLSFPERTAFTFIENHYAKQARKVQVASAANNDGTIIYEFYNPIKVLFVNNKNAEDVLSQADKFINQETPPKSPNLNQRKGSEGELIYLEFFENARTSTRSVLRDYYLRQPLKISSQIMKSLMKSKEITGDSLDFITALNDTIKEVTENVFLSSEYQGDKFIEFIRSRGYERDLVSIPRAGVELASNILHALAYSPKSFKKGVAYMMSTNAKDLMKLANEIGTTQFSRLFQGESITPRAESGGIGSRSVNWWDEQMKWLSSGILSKPDTWVAKPLWMGSFLSEFKKIDGNEFDADKFMEDPQYRKKIRETVNKARDIADAKLAQGFASMNPYEGIVASQVKKTDPIFSFKGESIADKYMTRFVRFEFQSAVDGINGMIGRGDISRTEGFQLLLATMIRMTAYSGALFSVQNLFFTAIESLLGAAGVDVGDREEEDLVKFTESLKMGALSSAMSLLVLRRLGNFKRIPIVFGVEWLNSIYGDDVGLRNTEKYNSFKNSILYSHAVSAMRIGADYKDTGKMAVDLVAGFSGPSNKIVKGVGRSALDFYAASEASKKSTKERRLKQAYKNLADAASVGVGIPLSRDLVNLYSREVYEDYVKGKNKGNGEASVFDSFEDFNDFSFDDDFEDFD